MSTTILLLFSLLNIVHYLFTIICVCKHQIVLLFLFPMYSFFVFFFSTSVMLSDGLWKHTFDGSLLAMGDWNPLLVPLTLISLPLVHRKGSHTIHSSILNCHDMQGPKAVWWLFYKNCFAGWILSTVFAITLLLLGISGYIVAKGWGLWWPLLVGLCSLSGVLPCPAHGAGHYFRFPRATHPGSDMAVLPVSSSHSQSLGLLDTGLGLSWCPPACPALQLPVGHTLAVSSARPPGALPPAPSPWICLTCTLWVIWISGLKGKHNLIPKLPFPLSKLWGLPGMHKGPNNGCDGTPENATGEGGFAVKWMRVEGSNKSAWRLQVSGLKTAVTVDTSVCLPQLSGGGQKILKGFLFLDS